MRYAFAFAAMPLVALALPANAAEVQIQATNPVVELSVTETVNAEPDMATVNAGVETRARSANEAARLNAVEMRKVVDRILALGVDRKDIQTSNFGLNAQYTYRNNQPPLFTGYQAINTVSVKLRDTDRVGDVLDALIAAGANNVSGPMFSLENDTVAKGQARELAWTSSLAKAREYARRAGYSDVRLLQVEESIQTARPYEMRAMAVTMDAAEQSTPIMAGQVGTMVTVATTWEMTG